MAPPKQRVVVSSSSVGHRQQDGFLSSAYREVTSAENVTIVRSVIVFGAAVAFFHSSFAEFLLPAL